MTEKRRAETAGETVDVAPGTRICLRGFERNYFLLLSGA